jgi:hypothetical protein
LPGNLEDWKKARRDFQVDNPNYETRHIEPVLNGRWALSTIISHWMRVNNIRPFLVWGSPGKNAPSIHLSGNSWGGKLMPVLAVQMMFVASNSVDLALCTGCSEPFLLSRGQSLHRNSYCLECRRRKIPQQRAAQNYHERERKSPNRKKRSALTEKQVASIRRTLKKRRPGTIEELAEKFNVSKWAIYKITEGKSWGLKLK